VHRAARFVELLGCAAGQPVTVDDVVRIFFHPAGYLRTVPIGAAVAVLINKAGGAAARAVGRALAEHLAAADHARRIARLAVGALADGGALDVLARR
jgi:probable selenium-dependent hydroxylase accessory protein YqeC